MKYILRDRPDDHVRSCGVSKITSFFFSLPFFLFSFFVFFCACIFLLLVTTGFNWLDWEGLFVPKHLTTYLEECFLRIFTNKQT